MYYYNMYLQFYIYSLLTFNVHNNKNNLTNQNKILFIICDDELVFFAHFHVCSSSISSFNTIQTRLTELHFCAIFLGWSKVKRRNITGSTSSKPRVRMAKKTQQCRSCKQLLKLQILIEHAMQMLYYILFLTNIVSYWPLFH